MVTVTKSIEFDYGHRIPDHQSKCRNIHGHRGRVVVGVVGRVQTKGSSAGMVLDFAAIKNSLVELVEKPFDHKCLLYASDPLCKKLGINPQKKQFKCSGHTVYGRVYDVASFGLIQELSVVPTAENLALLIFNELSRVLDTKDMLVQFVRFWETPTSNATFHRPEEMLQPY